MSIIEQFHRSEEHHWRNIGLRLLLVLATTVLIVWFMPRNDAQQFQYEIGEPWHYGTIIAKYDFPIYKTDEALQQERDSLLSMFQPYYDYDDQVESQSIGKFRSDFAKGMPDLPANFERIIVDRLHRLYQAGIMSTPDYNALHGDTTRLIRVIFGKNAESVQTGCIYSTKSAYEQLLSDEELSKERPALQRLNLNNYIVPNLIYDRAHSQTARNDLLSSISPASGMMMAGQKVIGVGDMVNEYNYRVLNSFQRELQRRNASRSQLTQHLAGGTIYVFTLVLLFTIYLAMFRKDYFEKPRSIAMLYLLITIFPIFVSLMMVHSYFSFSVYVLPFAFVPIFARVFMDSRTAFITHVTMVLICAAVLRMQYEFIVIQTVA